MNTAMLHHPAVQENMQTLAGRGCAFVSSKAGMLACGDVGDGRMAEPEEIFAYLERALSAKKDMQGVRVLVTAGPTREKIDDVRYLTNRSSGKMGYALAEAAAERGAQVTLVSGASLPAPEHVQVIPVVSAQDMYEACMQALPQVDLVVKAAAVADYTPKHKLSGKMKKGGDLALELVRTPDILKAIGQQKQGQVLVGFAAEAADLEKNALAKIKSKNLDLIAANENNAMTLYFADGSRKELPLAPKKEIADLILSEAMALVQKRH